MFVIATDETAWGVCQRRLQIPQSEAQSASTGRIRSARSEQKDSKVVLEAHATMSKLMCHKVALSPDAIYQFT